LASAIGQLSAAEEAEAKQEQADSAEDRGHGEQAVAYRTQTDDGWALMASSGAGALPNICTSEA
jgi:hypothetical protein